MMETPYVGVVESYDPIEEEALVALLCDFFRAVTGASQWYNIDYNENASVGQVACLPASESYQSHGTILPDRNPVYGDQCCFTPDVVITPGNDLLSPEETRQFQFDSRNLYYVFTYCDFD